MNVEFDKLNHENNELKTKLNEVTVMLYKKIEELQ